MAQAAISGGNPVEDVHTRTTASGPQSQAAVLAIDGSDSVIFAHATRGIRVDNAGTTITCGRTTVASVAGVGGAPQQLNGGTQLLCKSVFVCALQTNTQQIAVGNVNANAASASLNGIPLQPGQGISLDVSEVQFVYIDVLGDGHGVTWTAIG